MNIKDKKIILIVAILLIVLVVGFVLFLQNRNKEQYLSESIPQTTISKSDKKVSLKNLAKWVEDENYYLWEVKNDVKVQKVEQIAMDNNLKLIRSEEGVIYHWTKTSIQLIYNVSANTLTVIGSDVLSLGNLSTVNSQTFNELFKKYFDLDYFYEISQTENKDSGETVYYAKRYIDEKSVIEIASQNNQTDYIAVKGGKIVYAKLLLAEYINTEKVLPLISRADLEKFVNQTNYPKDFYPKMDVLNGDPVFEEIEYISSEYEKLLNSVDNCQTDDVKLVYLYKNMSQQYLTPVYRLDVQCTAQYKEKNYSIPGVMYVNAITPELISTEK